MWNNSNTSVTLILQKSVGGMGARSKIYTVMENHTLMFHIHDLLFNAVVFSVLDQYQRHLRKD